MLIIMARDALIRAVQRSGFDRSSFIMLSLAEPMISASVGVSATLVWCCRWRRIG